MRPTLFQKDKSALYDFSSGSYRTQESSRLPLPIPNTDARFNESWIHSRRWQQSTQLQWLRQLGMVTRAAPDSNKTGWLTSNPNLQEVLVQDLSTTAATSAGDSATGSPDSDETGWQKSNPVGTQTQAKSDQGRRLFSALQTGAHILKERWCWYQTYAMQRPPQLWIVRRAAPDSNKTGWLTRNPVSRAMLGSAVKGNEGCSCSFVASPLPCRWAFRHRRNQKRKDDRSQHCKVVTTLKDRSALENEKTGCVTSNRVCRAMLGWAGEGYRVCGCFFLSSPLTCRPHPDTFVSTSVRMMVLSTVNCCLLCS
ncbi:uncharacterized protein LOC110400223 [Numida meleagris]|uniref:uncharacterized protein LOC110400223 n=1 Tax=Numida meleagris TaxID=8996 RepID=UPI000B3D830A|nr:uncharacterized protein LOC110400223 [Numida meleagris]